MLSDGSASATAIAARRPAPPAPTIATSALKMSMLLLALADQHQLLIEAAVVGLLGDRRGLRAFGQERLDLVVPQVHRKGLQLAEHDGHQQALRVVKPSGKIVI